jgi:glycerol uptake facilitator-like aquaporin
MKVIQPIIEFIGTCCIIGFTSFKGTIQIVMVAITIIFGLACGLTDNLAGRQFNPAASLWAYMYGKIDDISLGVNIGSQLLGAFFMVYIGKVFRG